MEMGAHFAIITGLLYYLFSVIYFLRQPSEDKIRSIFSMTLWFTVYAFRLFMISSTCARVSLEVKILNNNLIQLNIQINDICIP